tara:strand:+ start:54 stop:605 length:552 start_codon:yes stop_codon:yes gene_type:complete
MSADLICVAAIKGAHGVRGQARVKSFTAEPEACCAYGPWLDEAGKPLLTPKSCRPASDDLVVTFTETLQREAIAAMRGTKVYVPRSALPPPDEDEFYHTDLIGLPAEDPSGAPMGRVVALHDFGAGDLIELENTPGREGRWVMAFTRANVPVVDIPGGRVVIVLPEEEDDTEVGGERPGTKTG